MPGPVLPAGNCQRKRQVLVSRLQGFEAAGKIEKQSVARLKGPEEMDLVRYLKPKLHA